MYWSESCVCTNTKGTEMNDIIEVRDEDQVANGQVSCDLRVNSDATESETQLGADDAIEQCPEVASEEFPAPIGKLLGLMITSSGTGRATVDFEASGRYANPMGTLHGGVLCDLADAAMDRRGRPTRSAGSAIRATSFSRTSPHVSLWTTRESA